MSTSDVAIRVEGLSKRYRIGRRQAGGTFREALSRAITAPFRTSASREAADADYWALEDVSFEVRRGEVMGIVGRNGAGKSTLLKILSRVTEPTTGKAEVYGRVGSLLEVGTGFHPELTGRENVYLNGAILGMHRHEIASKFDDIVAFAEVDRFIDTPVKHYSSGMYVRLAFAVAAHLEPEILVVDEVLAVGDAAFQARCIRHFQQMRTRGKTIVLISHNMGIIGEVCERAALIDHGRLLGIGEPGDIIDHYSNLQPSAASTMRAREKRQAEDPLRWGNGGASITSVYTRSDGAVTRELGAATEVEVVIEFEAHATLEAPVVGLAISNGAGVPVFATNSSEMGVEVGTIEPGRPVRAVFRIDNVFGDGLYTVSCAVNNHDRTRPYCREEDVHTFQVNGRSKRSLVWSRHTLTLEESDA